MWWQDCGESILATKQGRGRCVYVCFPALGKETRDIRRPIDPSLTPYHLALSAHIRHRPPQYRGFHGGAASQRLGVTLRHRQSTRISIINMASEARTDWVKSEFEVGALELQPHQSLKRCHNVAEPGQNRPTAVDSGPVLVQFRPVAVCL